MEELTKVVNDLAGKVGILTVKQDQTFSLVQDVFTLAKKCLESPTGERNVYTIVDKLDDVIKQIRPTFHLATETEPVTPGNHHSRMDEVEPIKLKIQKIWNIKKLDRKKWFAKHHHAKSQANIYEEWVIRDTPLLPVKFRIKPVSGQSEDIIHLRYKLAVYKFNTQIGSMKINAETFEKKFQTVDQEMTELFCENALNEHMLELLNNEWRQDCLAAETSAIKEWSKKQEWLEGYETKYGNDKLKLPKNVSENQYINPQKTHDLIKNSKKREKNNQNSRSKQMENRTLPDQSCADHRNSPGSRRRPPQRSPERRSPERRSPQRKLMQ
ncbi:hypothetical protein SNE40_013100 [Patella caerulea]|uniref:Uncharacterized protein n=1 Tax=Patella caerulea TaxID=87958 RepID=A0AAN8JQT5_PATCE